MAAIVTLMRRRLMRRRLPTLSTRIPPNASRSPYARSYTIMPEGSTIVSAGPTDLRLFLDPGGNFQNICKTPGLPYFDKTHFILPIHELGIVLLCRPRRFGKSYTVAMLDYFHGVQHNRKDKDSDKESARNKLFKGLAVDRDVQAEEIITGQYLIMKFDFSYIDRKLKVEAAAEYLRDNINDSLSRFISDYTPYLGNSLASTLSQFSPNNPVQRFVTLIHEVDHQLWMINKEGDRDNLLFNIEGIYLLAGEYDAFKRPARREI